MKRKYYCLEDTPIVGVWRKKGEPIELHPQSAQTYLVSGKISENAPGKLAKKVKAND